MGAALLWDLDGTLIDSSPDRRCGQSRARPLVCPNSPSDRA